MKENQREGFTLIELMVVVSIISMLASVVLAALQPARAQARDAVRKQEVHQIDTAIQEYISDNGHPPEWSGCEAQVTLNSSTVSGCVAVSTQGVDNFPTNQNPTTPWGQFAKDIQSYMPTLPVDPCGANCVTSAGVQLGYTYKPPAAVNYYSGSSNSTYQISAAMETGSAYGTVQGIDGLTYGIVKAADGRYWLDRNLGASEVATAVKDPASYGYYYQWGRGTDGHQISGSPKTNVLSLSDVPGNGFFITTDSPNFDWRNTKNDNLWQGLNGINNPCPTGFRVPTQVEWTALVSSSGITNMYTAFSSTNLKLPSAGYRGFQSLDIGIYQQGNEGRYWAVSTPPQIVYSYYLVLNSSSVYSNGQVTQRASGMPVRCIKD